MIAGAVYAIFHFFLGLLASVWSVRRLRKAGEDDGCLLVIVAVVAFIFWPFALCVLIVLALFDVFRSVD